MDKAVAGVIGAVTALAASVGVASAAPADLGAAMRSESYADLLRPIPNASALLAAREAEASGAFGEAHVIPAQIVIGVPGFRHHHHHHHRYWRRRYWHHHHHHHHRYYRY